MAILSTFGADKYVAKSGVLIMRLFALLLLSCLTCLGQPGPIPLRSVDAWPSASIPNPTNVQAGAFAWWVATDVAVGVTLSNQWSDRIQGLKSQNLQGARNPTNAAIGMRYNGGFDTAAVFSTNTTSGGSGFTIAVGGVGSMFAIVNCDNTANTRWIFTPVAQGNGPQITGTTLQYFGGVTGNYNVCTVPTGQDFDFAVVFTTTNDVWYTNGVIALTKSVTGGPNDYPQGCFGTRATAQNSIQGYIVEGIWWTNTFLTAGKITSLHKYATNTYGYTP